MQGRGVATPFEHFDAFIYGAGDAKLGRILGSDTAAGKKSKENFMKNLPALGKLVTGVKAAAQTRGYLKTIDGGKLGVRKAHAALNTLLQSAGAIFMKKALVLLDETLQAHGLSPSRDYEFCANIHDELQIDVLPEHVELVKKLAPESIKNAGEAFGFRCPLAGNADEGATWKDTH